MNNACPFEHMMFGALCKASMIPSFASLKVCPVAQDVRGLDAFASLPAELVLHLLRASVAGTFNMTQFIALCVLGSCGLLRR